MKRLLWLSSFILMLSGCTNKPAKPEVNDMDTSPSLVLVQEDDKQLVVADRENGDTLFIEKFPLYGFTGDEDTIFTKTFDLKGGYQLIFYPETYYSIDRHNEARILYCQNARLVGEGIDTLFMDAPGSQSKLLLRYDSLDFDDCFVIEYSGGGSGSLYVDVIEKKTARRIVDEQGASHYDLKNQLILYEDVGGQMMIYDAKHKRFHEIDMPDHPCYGGMGARFSWDIERVTSRYIYLSNFCDSELGVKPTKVDRLKYTAESN